MAVERIIANVVLLSAHVPAGTRAQLLPLGEVAARPLTTVGIGRAGFTDAPPGYRRSVLGPRTHRAMITLSGSGFFQANGERHELPAGTLLVWPAGVAATYGTTSDVSWRRIWVSLANLPRWASITRGGVRCEPTDAGAKLKLAMEGLLEELGPVPELGADDPVSAIGHDIDPSSSGTAPALRGGASSGTAPALRGGAVSGCGVPLVRINGRTEHANNPSESPGWAYPPRPDAAARARAVPANLYARILRAHVHGLLRVPDVERVESDGARLDRLWAHVRQHLSQDWTVDNLAKRMAVAPATLHRMTQRRYGTTPGGLLLRMRMEEAQRLLALTDEPVQKLAERFGYASPFAFSTAFKRATGLAPRAFRDNSRTSRDHS